jgi:threonine aldolase
MQIDLRSDTVTQPSPGMLQAMFNAQVGDDVLGEDPTVNALEKEIAQLFGMEAALFCLSGTMSNQIAIKCHTQPGQEVICEAESHVYYYEAGGIASNSLCQVNPVKGQSGQLNASQILTAINPIDIHKATTSLVCLENTTNRGGGSFYSLSNLEQIKALCQQHNLALHLDGARLWNAAVASQTNLSDYGKIFDSISVCFNKGMGCPIGSALIGNAAYIHKARKVRKAFGGGWRQAGYMAAAVQYALQNNYTLLQTDHTHAQQLADTLQQCPWVSNVMPRATNIIIFNVQPQYTASQVVQQLAAKGILCFPFGGQSIRFVTHLNVSSSQIQEAQQILLNLYN